jgi:DNA-binding CsgD family transcriptional regulator
VKELQYQKSAQVQAPRPTFPRKLYFFYERNTGVSPFHVVAGPDGQFPMEQADGLLAMHCMVGGQTPLDYLVMVQAADAVLKGVTERAQKLLHSWHLVSPVQLTRREEDILDGILRRLENKEIAASLHLSLRTVKFHVSNLLAKFHVKSRADLLREAARRITVPIAPPQPPATQNPTHTLTLQQASEAKRPVLKVGAG